MDRAQKADPTFKLTDTNAADIAKLCNYLEGLPLAIELAAAYTSTLTIAEMLDGLPRFQLLVSSRRDLSERQRSMRATMEWSYTQLTPDLQQFFKVFALFHGGCTSDAAQAVYGTEAVSSLRELQNHSLIFKFEIIEDGAPPKKRFRMLETIREFANEKLAASEDYLQRQTVHAEYYLEFAEKQHTHYFGADKISALNDVELEISNIHAALDFFIFKAKNYEKGLRLVGAVQRFWYNRGYFLEGRRYSETVLQNTDAQQHTDYRANALNGAGVLAEMQGDYEEALWLYEESLAISRETGSVAGMGAALGNMGDIARVKGDYEQATALLEQSLDYAQQQGDKWHEALCQSSLGEIAYATEDLDRAQTLFEQALGIQLYEEGDLTIAAHTYMHLGQVHQVQGRWDQAQDLYNKALAIRQASREKRGIANCLIYLGQLQVRKNELIAARSQLTEGLVLCQEFKYFVSLCTGLEGMAELEYAASNPELATRLFAAAQILRTKVNIPGPKVERQAIEPIIAKLQHFFPKEWQLGLTLKWEDLIGSSLADSTNDLPSMSSH